MDCIGRNPVTVHTNILLFFPSCIISSARILPNCFNEIQIMLLQYRPRKTCTNPFSALLSLATVLRLYTRECKSCCLRVTLHSNILQSHQYYTFRGRGFACSTQKCKLCWYEPALRTNIQQFCQYYTFNGDDFADLLQGNANRCCPCIALPRSILRFYLHYAVIGHDLRTLPPFCGPSSTIHHFPLQI